MATESEDMVDDELVEPGGYDPNSTITTGASEPDVGSEALSGVGDDGPDRAAGKFTQGVPESFPEELRADFELMLQGKRLTASESWLGHQYTLQQLDCGQMMDVGLVHKQYAGTLGDVKAYQVALLAASVIRVDDDPLPIPPSLKTASGEVDVVFLDRFRHVRSWFPPTVDHLYEVYMALDTRVQDILEAMGNQ